MLGKTMSILRKKNLPDPIDGTKKPTNVNLW
jgi:hypothetical protein